MNDNYDCHDSGLLPDSVRAWIRRIEAERDERIAKQRISNLVNGTVGFGISGVFGLGAVGTGGLSFVIDKDCNAGLVLTLGWGGGGGASVGLTKTSYPDTETIYDISRYSYQVGLTIIAVGAEKEVPDGQTHSVSIWIPRLGGEFHATISISIRLCSWRMFDVSY